MAIIGEMKKLTVGNKTYTLPSGGGGEGSVTSVGVSNATNGGLSVSGSPITTSGTITVGHSNVLSSAQTTQAVYPIKIDKNGHVSAYGSAVTSMPASDVSAWAKASTKPSYTASEVGALPSTTAIPTKTSDLTNDSGYITGYTETDPTVPSWAKQSSKPSYTASEVGAADSSHGHGDISNRGDCTTNTTIASGDRLMVNDESASRIRNSSITFGTSTSQYLSNTGTWESIPTELPASDVYSWAKAASKPSYTASEVGAVGLSNGYADDSQLLSAATIAKWQAILS